MNALLLQNIAPELAEHVKRVARNERCTINDAVLALLQRGIAANDAPRLVAPVVCASDAPVDAQEVAESDPEVADATAATATAEAAMPVAVETAAEAVATPMSDLAPAVPVAAAPEPLLPDDFDGTPEERAIAMAEALALREALLLARDIPGPGF